MNSLHENSRDAKRLRAAGAREEKLHRIMDAALKSNQIYGTCRWMLQTRHSLTTMCKVDRIAWFKSALEGSVGAVSDDEIHVLTQGYVWTITWL